jgi:hypothetical protein
MSPGHRCRVHSLLALLFFVVAVHRIMVGGAVRSTQLDGPCDAATILMDSTQGHNENRLDCNLHHKPASTWRHALGDRRPVPIQRRTEWAFPCAAAEQGAMQGVD